MNEPYNPTPPPPGPMGGPPTAPPPGGPPAHPGLPWERSKDMGSLVETVKLLVTSPGRAFAEAREKGDYGSPLLFALIFLVIGAIFQQLWNLLFGASMFAGLAENMGDLPPEFRDALMQSAATGPVSLVIGIIVTPIVGILVLFIWSGLVHLVLQLVGGLQDSTAGFEGTFRSLAYSEVAYLSMIVPIVGQFIFLVWFIVLQVIGISTLHRTSQGKALAAVLIPFVLCCCIAVALAIFFGAAIAAMVGAAGN